MTGIIASAQRSRRTRYCSEEWAHDRTIQFGDLYVRLVAFPGHDANTDGPSPSVMILCAQCADAYPVASAALAKRAP